ncbi:MAG TPA: tripartite tricarboxylate transporter substrate binding protein [Burkholderiales bacterium]|nr:tripartite tricarboxylate transporter substrate binding protein [Burkholderiales bacterium]
MSKLISTLIICAVVGTSIEARGASASGYPAKPVRMVVSGSPGGSNDVMARMLAPKLTEIWGQTVLIDNRAGGAGIIAADIVAKAPPDGYTIGFVAIRHSVNPTLVKLPYDPVNDFEPITMTAAVGSVLVVNAKTPIKSVKELIALAKQKPGELTFASSGLGGAPHLTGELFALTTGIKLVHVPYKGGVPAITDLAGGRVSMSFPTLTTSLAFIKNGSLRPLAVLSKERSAYLPDVPTMAEAGVPNVVVRDWQGILAPRGVPKPIVDKLVTDIRRVLKDPANQERFASSGFEVIASTPAEFRAALTSEIQRWARVVKDAHIKLE